MSEQAFLVVGCWGDDMSGPSWPVAVFLDEERAQRRARNLEAFTFEASDWLDAVNPQGESWTDIERQVRAADPHVGAEDLVSRLPAYRVVPVPLVRGVTR